MMHQYQPKESTDRILWDRMKDDQKRLLNWAMQHQNDVTDGVKANAFHILYNYYMGGWCGLPQDQTIAKEYLRKSAALGHARAIYDFTRDVLGSSGVEEAKKYIVQAMQQGKLDDVTFNFNNHNQTSMKQEIQGLLHVIEATEKMCTSPRCRYTL